MRTQLLATFMILAVAPIRAQTIDGASASQKVIQETGRMLRQAQSNSRNEAARQTADRAADNGRLGQLAGEAQKKLAKTTGNDAGKLVDAIDQRLGPALSSAAPEGRAIIAQSAVAPATRAPDPNSPQGVSPSSTTPSGARAVGGKKGKAAESPPKDIDIRSEGAAYFTSVESLAIFTDDVVVDHPQFHMTCDKLEVYFFKAADQKPAPEKPAPEKDAQGKKIAEPAAPPKAQPVDSPVPQTEDAKLKQAIATGKKVVIRKIDENGEPQIGICRNATYVGESGDIILREMPQVQRGSNVILARDSSTYMVLKQNGELKVHGPADTKIQQKPDLAGKPKATTPAPSGGVPSDPPTLTPKKTDKK